MLLRQLLRSCHSLHSLRCASSTIAIMTSTESNNSGWLFYPHYLHLHFKRSLPSELPVGEHDERAWWRPIEMCFSNEIDMYRSSDFSYSQFPIGLTFTVTPLEKTTTIVNGRPSAPPVLSIEFRNDMLRRPHMTHKGRCIVDVRIHASPPPPPGGMIVQLEVSATGDLANRILPACQLIRLVRGANFQPSSNPTPMSEIFDSIVHGNAATPDAEIDAQPTAEHDDVESDSEHCEEEHEHEHDQVSGTACVHWHAFPVDSNQTASIATAGSISSVPVQRAAVQIRPVSSRPSATAHQQPAAPAASTPDRIWVAEEVGGAVGGRVWDAALYAREYLQRILAKAPGFFDGKRILDLGSGTGVLGIWLYAWLCRQRPRSRTTVVVSDQAELMPLLERNVRFNQLIHQSTAEDAPRIEAHEYSWGESVEHLGGTFDFVIASDTLYQPALFPVLFSALTDTTHATSTILLSYRRRGVDEHHQELFFDRLVDHSLTARPANNADGIGDGNCHFFVVSRIKNE